MRVLAHSISVFVLLSAAAIAQSPAWAPAPGHLTLDLWPHGAPGAATTTAAEVDTTTAKDHMVAGKPVIRLGNVSRPTLTIYAPKQNNTGAAIVVFPGGAYRILAIDLEGTEVCDWLNSIGVTCILVKYRVPDSGPYPKSSAALQDAQRDPRHRALSRSGVAHRSEAHRSAGILRGSASFCRTQHALRSATLRSGR